MKEQLGSDKQEVNEKTDKAKKEKEIFKFLFRDLIFGV